MADDQVKVRRLPHVELKKGRVQWYIRIVAANGRKLLTSQKYFSYGNARRAGRDVANEFKIALKEDQ